MKVEHTMEKFDVIVIGGGPGGYVAAIRASQNGLKTALVEKEHLGGICLNWGCIPTKALLKSGELLQKIKHAEEFGISAKSPIADIEKIVGRSRDISEKLVGGIKGLLKKNKVTVFEGAAKIINPKVIAVDGKDGKLSLEAKNIIIATGARARTLEGFKPDGKHIWTYREALVPKTTPKSMIIVGSGAIGIEFASFYNAIGVDVTVLEAADRILPVEDLEISAIAKKAFEARGIKFYTGVKLDQQKTNNGKVVLTFECQNVIATSAATQTSLRVTARERGNLKRSDEKSSQLPGIATAPAGPRNDDFVTLEAEILLMAIGIVPNTENLGLENTKIKLDRGHIITSGPAQTAEPNIYAIGDVAGAPWLAHKASHEGIIAADHIAGKKPHLLNKLSIPGCTYSSPQIASVGMTEEAAKLAGRCVKIGRFPFYANGKALILGDTEGMIKTIFDAKTGEILGAHMIGSEVTELIQGYVIAKDMEGTELDLMNAIFPHPTLSEMMHESVLQAYNNQIHL